MFQSRNSNEPNYKKIVVSIIIPAYNEESVLADCLNSISNQIYPDSHFEVLLVNDGSTDRTVEIAKSFIKDHPNVSLLSKENGGKASAQNHGLKYAKGKYILITDADAVVEKEWISKMVKNLDKYDMVMGSCYAKDPKTWLEKIQHAHYLIKFKYEGLRGIPSTGVNNAFRRDIIDIIGVFDETKTSITWDYIKRAIKKGFKVYYDSNIIVHTKCTNNLIGFYQQKLRWREGGISNPLNLGFVYTYGLSLFLFGSFFLSIYMQDGIFFIFPFFIIYLLSFSIYAIPFLKMIRKNEDRYYAIFFILYEFIEMSIRLLLVPYIVFRFIRPRKKPTFAARRD